MRVVIIEGKDNTDIQYEINRWIIKNDQDNIKIVILNIFLDNNKSAVVLYK